jgi:hypothetical protein
MLSISFLPSSLSSFKSSFISSFFEFSGFIFSFLFFNVVLTWIVSEVSFFIKGIFWIFK